MDFPRVDFRSQGQGPALGEAAAAALVLGTLLG